MKSQTLSQFASKRFEKFTYDSTDKSRIEKSIKFLPLSGKILDIGCGDGQISKKIMKQTKSVVYGIDIAQKSLDYAAKNGILVKHADVTKKLPFQANFFDGVYASEIIEHLIDPDNFVKEIHRVLKKGGTLVITTPNFIGLGSRLSILLGQTPWMMNNRLDPKSSGHIRYFRPQELRTLLTDQGFEKITITSNIVRLQPFINSQLLAKIFPEFGLHIIVNAQRK